MIAYKMYENNIIFSIIKNVMHHLRKSNILFISLKICIFQCLNSICIHNKIYTPQLYFLTQSIKMIPNMNGFDNRLLKNWTVLRTFQMPLVSSEITNSKVNRYLPRNANGTDKPQ